MGRGRLLAVRLTLAVVAVGAGASALLPPSTPPPSTDASGPVRDAPPEVVLEAAERAPAAEPARLRIPRLELDGPLVALGVDAAGALVPPADFLRAGWFAPGIAPGDVGPAVIAGHVDSRDGPAVFFRLAELGAGDQVLVDRADGTTVAFTVTRVARYPKDAFPTDEVYGPTPDAELRLITCGGDFDRGARSYRDNVVVYARLS